MSERVPGGLRDYDRKSHKLVAIESMFGVIPAATANPDRRRGRGPLSVGLVEDRRAHRLGRFRGFRAAF